MLRTINFFSDADKVFSSFFKTSFNNREQLPSHRSGSPQSSKRKKVPRLRERLSFHRSGSPRYSDAGQLGQDLSDFFQDEFFSQFLRNPIITGKYVPLDT